MITEDKELTGEDRDIVDGWYGEYAEVCNAPKKVVRRESHRNHAGMLEETTVTDTSLEDEAFKVLQKKLQEKFFDVPFNTLHINTDFFPIRYFLQMHDDISGDGFKIWQW